MIHHTFRYTTDLSGASENLRLYCKGNKLASIKLSQPLKSVSSEYAPENEINPQQSGYGPAKVQVTTTP